MLVLKLVHIAVASFLFTLTYSQVLSRAKAGAKDFTLTVLHTNDVHSHFEQSNRKGGPCNPKKVKECVAGVARLQTAVKMLKKRYPYALFLNGGDFYQGSTWYTVLKHRIVSAVMAKLGYNAVCLGNHEFDDGPDGLAPFLKNMTKARVKVVTSNVDTSDEPKLAGADVLKSFVFNIRGTKVGIVGAVTTETLTIATPGKVRIEDEIQAIQREAKKLTEQGVKVIVAVTHTGYKRDIEIVGNVTEIDLLVGGHTNTFLYSGEGHAEEDKPEGPYPTVVNRPDKSIGLVVQDFWFAKYLGFLRVRFDKEGRVRGWSGNPILLDQSYKEDEEMLKLLKPFREEVEEAGKKPIGSSKVHLEADNKICRLGECNMCNMIADAFFSFYADMNTTSPDLWSNVNAAIVNSGFARSSLPQSDNLTMFDVMRALPYQSDLVVLTLTGAQLRHMFEHGVAEFTVDDDPRGEFLQVSGMKVKIDLAREKHKRVTKLCILCNNCTVPRYEKVQESKLYTVVTTSYIWRGGDGFKFDSTVKMETKGVLDSDVYIPYIQKMSPMKTAVEGRVKVLNMPVRKVTGRSDEDSSWKEEIWV